MLARCKTLGSHRGDELAAGPSMTCNRRGFMRSALYVVSSLNLACAGCVTGFRSRPALPAGYTVVREQLTVHCDFPLAGSHRLLEELTARRGDLQSLLGIPISDEPIHVYLFDNREVFSQFMRLYHPNFPDRRAFFLESDTKLQVYAQWGDRVAEDLRHEVTHAYLHAVVPNLPLWLDEGLAEYSEVPRGRHGLSAEHLGQLLARLDRHGWRPDLARLERLDPRVDMVQEDYAESWAWTHFLLEAAAGHRGLLRQYLFDLRREGATRSVSARLHEQIERPEEALVAHLRALSAESSQ